MPRSGKVRRVIDNDDAWILAFIDPPLTPEKIWSDMVAPHEGSPVDALLYSIGGHDVYDYETKIGLTGAEAYVNAENRNSANRGANLAYLMRNHGGPLTVLTEQCHRLGIDFMPSLRMNEHYPIPYDDPSYGKVRIEHPEWTIGRGKDLPENSTEWGVGRGLDYAVPEVRDYICSILIETIERWDVDGLELDFFRHPTYFNIQEAYSNRYLMTDLVRRVRRRMDEIGLQRGKGLDLMVRVPATIERCEGLGLDILKWIDEGLVDIVVAGGGFIPFEMPMEQFVEAAQGTDTLVYGCLEGYRPAVDELTLRAIASRYWSAGIDGLYLFNFYSMPRDWKRDVLGRLTDREGLKRLMKRYETDPRDRFSPTGYLQLTFLNAIPRTQLPVTLRETSNGEGLVVKMDITEDFEKATAEGAMGTCTLSLLFDNLSSDDDVRIKLNGTDLGTVSRSTDGWTREFYQASWNVYPSGTLTEHMPGVSLDVDVTAPPLASGVNEIEVELVTSDSSRENDLVLQQIRLWVRYE